MPVANAAIEKRIDMFLEQEQSAQIETARATVRARFLEEERLAREAEEHAKAVAAREAYLDRVRAAHEKACTRYKAAVDEFRAARVQLQSLDTLLARSGFSGHSLGIELRHAIAAPDEGDIHHAYGAAVNAMRKTLGEPR